MCPSDQGDAGFGRVHKGSSADVRKSAGLSDIGRVYSTRLQQAIGSRSVAEFGRLCDLSHSTLLNYLKGTLPGWDNALKIARAAGRPLDWFAGDDALPPELLDAARGMDSTGHFARQIEARYAASHSTPDQQFALLPLYDVRASAGHGAWNDAERISKQLAFRRDWIGSTLNTSAEHLVLIYVDGDSMEPRFADGDVVMVDTSVNEVRTDGIFVFTLDDALLIKRLQRLAGGRLRVVSENPVYQPFEIPAAHLYTTDESPHHVVGRVVWGGIRL